MNVAYHLRFYSPSFGGKPIGPWGDPEAHFITWHPCPGNCHDSIPICPYCQGAELGVKRFEAQSPLQVPSCIPVNTHIMFAHVAPSAPVHFPSCFVDF